jgi:hypothetical protein
MSASGNHSPLRVMHAVARSLRTSPWRPATLSPAKTATALATVCSSQIRLSRFIFENGYVQHSRKELLEKLHFLRKALRAGRNGKVMFPPGEAPDQSYSIGSDIKATMGTYFGDRRGSKN